MQPLPLDGEVLERLVIDIPMAAIEAEVGVSSIRRWIKNGWLEPVTRKPRIMVRASEVRRVQAECDERRRANLRRG